MTKLIHAAIAGTLLGLNGVAAQAGPDGEGFYIRGYAELSYAVDGGSNETFGTLDLDLGYSASSAIGYNLGIDAIILDSDNYYALYPAAVIGTGFGDVSVGIPRSVYDSGYFPSMPLGTSSYFGLEIGAALGSVAGSSYLFETDVLPLGLRWDGRFGGTQVGASYHRVSGPGSDFDTVAVAFRHEMDAISSFYDMVFFGGFEYAFDGSSDYSAHRIGAEGGTDNWRTGLIFDVNDNISEGLVTAYGNYALNDNWTLDAFVMNINSGGTDTFYGAGAKFQPTDTLYVDANVTGYSGASDPIWELTVGLSF
ncbi:MAG: hypothetical protein GY945_11340 [Rhodobacteraceae bacterium]|nr:hypothetical protein [Paracoccaceae bacterium]